MRGVAALLALAVAAIVVGSTPAAGQPGRMTDVVQRSLEHRAKADPNRTFRVIIQASDGARLAGLATTVSVAQRRHPGTARGLRKTFELTRTAAAELTGAQLEEIATLPGIVSVTEDASVRATGLGNRQSWPETVGLHGEPAARSAHYPTIAIVDSGVEPRGDFGNRLIRQVDFTSTGTNSPGDGFGHGTLVAGLAAGGGDGFSGVEPRARILSLDVLDDTGAGRVSDLLAACDWILTNKDRFQIGVVNFSLNAAVGGVQNDPLDRAVEKLWLNGIVVVAAAGNYATGGAESGVGFAPADDPFVITVGAADTNGTVSPSDDFAAPWSAWGRTRDGFRKPDIAAPGRVLNGPAPEDSTLLRSNPGRRVADGYMWMSGTSFAAPIVSGAAATVLASHPDWTPDQVKGALMAGASAPTGSPAGNALGAGIVNIPAAIAADGTANPNAALDRFVVADSRTRTPTFDAAGWAATAASDPTWDQASWSSASWSSASWSSASWSSMSWANMIPAG